MAGLLSGTSEASAPEDLQPERNPAVREILDLVGGRWSLAVVVALDREPLRYGALCRAFPGISKRMLTLTLRQLERDGLVTRTVQAEVPLQVIYNLSELGTTLLEPSAALAAWAVEKFPSIIAARAAYDTCRLSG